MHGASSLLAETIDLMTRYPHVYADLARQNWSAPRAEFHARLRALMDAGLGKRLLFGSDPDMWLDAIGAAIAAVESAPFLSAAAKQDIFLCNAARFFRLLRPECE